MNRIEDIKQIRISTNCKLTDCDDAYERCNHDVDMAISFLLSKNVAETSVSLSEEEKSKLEAYKKAAHRRVEKKSKKRSEKKIFSIIFFVASLLLIISFVGTLICQILDSSNGLVTVIIISGIMGIVCFCAGIAIWKMSDESYKVARETKITEVQYGDNDIIRCPHCGSEHMTYQKKGFSEAKALIGMSLIGIWGVMFGVPGKHKIKATCLKCGHSFMIKKK